MKDDEWKIKGRRQRTTHEGRKIAHRHSEGSHPSGVKKGINMGKELRILILEDVPEDASLMEDELRKAGIAFVTQRVETRESFVKGIQDFDPDLILAEYNLPSFDGLSALTIAREQRPDVPFIFVTGSLSEEVAVGCMKSGATDYVLKNHLIRIGPAIKWALEKRQAREEKERTEEVLRVSDIRYRRLFESAKDGILLLDGDTAEITDVNPYMVEMLGYSYDELLGKRLWNVGPFKDKEKTQVIFRELQKEGYVRYDNLLLETKDGKPIHVEFASSAYYADDKKVIQCTIRDITERKRAKEALEKSETKSYELFNDAPVGYFEYDTQGRITSVNRTELEMLGYTLEEMVGQPAWKFVVEEDESRHQISARLAGVLPPARGLERTYRRKDGTTFPTLIWNRLLQDSEGKIIGIRSTIQDITERKQMEKEKALLEEQLRQSQKMEAMGRLAGGIAHDFNNLLTIIKGYSQLFLIDLKKGDPMEKGIEQIQKATQRASDLIRQLLAFSRRQVMAMKVLDLNNLLRELDKMLRRVIREDIVLVTLLAEELGRVRADPGQMEQVLMNLVVNARDAMPSGGKLTIETANVVLDEEYVRTHIEVPLGRYVMLSVSDTGVGMTPDVRDRIFEPFFTTKEKGRGTGLGLSTVYGIVKQSGGNIWVYSEPGKGTTFKIYLPVVDGPLEEWAEMVVGGGELPRGKETVLVVEDFEEVRQLARQVLERQEYTVLEAANGNETLQVCERHKGKIHLMVTDVVMPGMSGRELADRIKSSHPEMKILYTSGYADDTIVHYGVKKNGVNYLQKPFTMEGLARKVREVLDR